MNPLSLLKDKYSKFTTWLGLRDDLKRLNKVRDGLGEEAINYVLSGEGGTVLSTLSTLCKDDPLEVCVRWSAKDSPVPARRRLLARGDPYEPDLAYRYTEVLCAAGASTQQQLVGGGTLPLPLRVFFTEAFRGLLDERSNKPVELKGKGLVVERAIMMTERLGGTLADFIELLYVSDDYYGGSGRAYRVSEAAALRELFRAQVAVVCEKIARLPAQERVACLTDLHAWGLSKDDAFTPLLVGQAGDTSKAVREAAINALAAAPAAGVAQLATSRLSTGTVHQRAGMVDLFARLGLPDIQAVLTAHREKEKTARIVSALDTVLDFLKRKASDTPDDATAYTALDGRRIAIPALRPLASGTRPTFGDSELKGLKALIAAANEKTQAENLERKAKGWHQVPLLEERHAPAVIRCLNGEPVRIEQRMLHFLSRGQGQGWIAPLLAQIPDAQALPIVRGFDGDPSASPHVNGPGAARMEAYLARPDADLRVIEALDVAAAAAIRQAKPQEQQGRPVQKGDFLRRVLQFGQVWRFQRLPAEALESYLADNLTVFDEAFGLAPGTGIPLDRTSSIELLGLLPALPARCYASLLECGAGERKAGRAQARALLGEAPGLDERLVGLLDDPRQGVRAGVAQWIGTRGKTAAIAPLRKRLRKEKSEAVRAALLTALNALGEDLSKDFDPELLLKEAQKGLKSAHGSQTNKPSKLGWLTFKDLGPLRLSTGARLPEEVLRWWAELAVKLKQPGGNALFEIYLDQLVPEDAARFSTWILESWIAFDIAYHTGEAATAYARAQIALSGLSTKGLLALALRAPPALAAERVRSFLKTHGWRTSQAGALLELLAGIAEPLTLQVVIAASLRLKQKSTQRLAGQLILKVAEARDWTLDELSDRTIPDAGFDDSGALALPCGEDAKPYEAYLDRDLAIKLRNPAGSDVSGLPSGQDEHTRESKKQLSSARKVIKEVSAMQAGRLRDALCSQRVWPREDWQRFFHGHPLMSRLIWRVLFVGVDGQGVLHPFRPTPEGDFTDAWDNAVDISTFQEIRLAHGSLLDEQANTDWAQHLSDYEVTPVFTQIGRPLLGLPADKAGQSALEDRRGWTTDGHTLRGAAAKLGYERGASDYYGDGGGFFSEYLKSFPGAGLTAVISFTGNSIPEQAIPVALRTLGFRRTSGRNSCSSEVKLGEVPPVLLSECWNDYHEMAAKAVYDPEWNKRSPW